ncbi:MAG: hypothetical protein Q7T56_03605 [Nocardioidaceae bacterium]|nr:hypothetical protein [Nocardioidaceae bacterium]
MGALSSVEGEVARLARAMEAFADAAGPARGILRDVPAEDTAPSPQADAVATALSRLDARLEQLAVQAGDAAAVLGDLLADAVDDAQQQARSDAARSEAPEGERS